MRLRGRGVHGRECITGPTARYQTVDSLHPRNHHKDAALGRGRRSTPSRIEIPLLAQPDCLGHASPDGLCIPLHPTVRGSSSATDENRRAEPPWMAWKPGSFWWFSHKRRLFPLLGAGVGRTGGTCQSACFMEAGNNHGGMEFPSHAATNKYARSFATRSQQSSGRLHPKIEVHRISVCNDRLWRGRKNPGSRSSR